MRFASSDVLGSPPNLLSTNSAALLAAPTETAAEFAEFREAVAASFAALADSSAAAAARAALSDALRVSAFD